MKTLPALSIRQPWAWLIVRPDITDPNARLRAYSNDAIKRVENRAWNPHNPGRRFRGEFLIHAAKGCTREEYREASFYAGEIDINVPPLEELQRGGIVGMATVIDWVEDGQDGFNRGLHDTDPQLSHWYVGPGALVLADIRPLPFFPCAGALGFFRNHGLTV